MLPVDLARTFAIGQRLQGEVVRLVPQGGVLVNFDGQPVLLALAHMLSSHPWLHEMAPALSQELRDTLAALYPQSALPPDAAQLKDQIDRSGLNYESKVQRMLMGDLSSAVAALAKDLKGQLLEL